MAERDRDVWDARHEGADPEPTAPFGADHLPAPSVGTHCLDVATGSGVVALWALDRGMHVTAVDISRVGLANLASTAERRHPDAPLRVVEHDLDDGLGVDGAFDLVVCRWFRDPALYDALVAAVAPGGWLSIAILGGDGPFAGTAEELVEGFATLGPPIAAFSDERGHRALFHRAG